jgi:hypothetical protein
MWMDAYVQETLMRDQIAEADRQAALRHLVRSTKRPSGSTRVGCAIRRLADAVSLPRLKQLMERTASS